MKERGVLPKHLRFQVSIPMVNSVLPPRIFPNQEDLAKIRLGYVAATRAEIATIIAKIPNGEPALQWDCSTNAGGPIKHLTAMETSSYFPAQN
jgi:hypothetical protein